jgi:Domain of unknown function (DUF6950)
MALIKKEHYLTEELHDFIVERLNKPFAWGENDCASFAGDAILAITGVDIAAEFRGAYKSERGAAKVIKRITGGSTIADAAVYCAVKHGLVEYDYPLMAKRGDLVLIENGDGKTIAGIIGLHGHPISPGVDGLVQFPITSVRRAWSIGDEHHWSPPTWHPTHPSKLVEDMSLPALPASIE